MFHYFSPLCAIITRLAQITTLNLDNVNKCTITDNVTGNAVNVDLTELSSIKWTK